MRIPALKEHPNVNTLLYMALNARHAAQPPRPRTSVHGRSVLDYETEDDLLRALTDVNLQEAGEGSSATITRLKNIDNGAFQVDLQKEEDLPKEYVSQTMNFLAWEPSTGSVDGFNYEVGRTGNVVNHNLHEITFGAPFEELPVFF